MTKPSLLLPESTVSAIKQTSWLHQWPSQAPSLLLLLRLQHLPIPFGGLPWQTCWGQTYRPICGKLGDGSKHGIWVPKSSNKVQNKFTKSSKDVQNKFKSSSNQVQIKFKSSSNQVQIKFKRCFKKVQKMFKNFKYFEKSTEIIAHLPLIICLMLLTKKCQKKKEWHIKSGGLGQIFVAFSEYLNFKNTLKKFNLPCWWSLRGQASLTRWGWCRGFRAWFSSWRWCTRACSFRIRPKQGPCSLHLQSPWIKLVKVS